MSLFLVLDAVGRPPRPDTHVMCYLSGYHNFIEMQVFFRHLLHEELDSGSLMRIHGELGTVVTDEDYAYRRRWSLSSTPQQRKLHMSQSEPVTIILDKTNLEILRLDLTYQLMRRPYKRCHHGIGSFLELTRIIMKMKTTEAFSSLFCKLQLRDRRHSVAQLSGSGTRNGYFLWFRFRWL